MFFFRRKNKKPIYYGWWVSIAGSFNLMISSGPTFQAASTLFKAIEDEFGWSRALVSGVASFGRFGGALFGPIEGWLTDKFGAGKMILFGFTFAGIGMIIFSKISGPLMYYFSFFIVSLGFSLGGFVPSMHSVNTWMSKRRATGMAIVISGSSLGGVFVPFIVWSINNYGWRETTLIIGIVTIIAGPPLSFIIGKKFDGYENISRKKNIDTKSKSHTAFQYDFKPSEAIKTRGFWGISITHTFTNLSVGAVSAHIFFQLTDINGANLSDSLASTILPIMAFTAFFFQMIGGFVGDKFSKRKVLPFLILIQGSSLIVLGFANTYLHSIIFALLWGIGFGARTPMLHALRGEYFGKKHFGMILGMSSFPMMLGMMISPVIVGRIYDIHKSYEGILYFLGLTCVVASITILFAKKPTPPNIGIYENEK